MNSLQQSAHSPIISWLNRMTLGGVLGAALALLLVPDAWAVQASPVSLSFRAVQGVLTPRARL